MRNAIPFCKCVMTPWPFPGPEATIPRSRKNTRRSRRFSGVTGPAVPRGAIGYLEFRHRSGHGLIDFPIVRALVPSSRSPCGWTFYLLRRNTFGKNVPAIRTKTNELCQAGQSFARLLNKHSNRETDRRVI